jgi:predicted TIM-barrel fold metal-dependent hydrolase
MSHRHVGRRAFLQGVGLAAVGAAGFRPARAAAQFGAPYSTGTERATLEAPAGACDCHHHIYDARFPARVPPAPGARPEPDATVADYRLLQRRIGTTRNVVVTPGLYYQDNSVALDAIAQFGPQARGVAVVLPNIGDAELRTLHDGGIRGIRFTSFVPGSLHSIEMVEPLSKRVHALGWHVEINMDADGILAHEDLWRRLASPVVFDHMGRFPLERGVEHPAFAVVRRLLDQGRTWVKLSFGERDSKVGPPDYPEPTHVAEALVRAAPERLVWGTNWPHPGGPNKADDALVFDLLARWAPDAATRRRILVENPEALYGFPRA